MNEETDNILGLKIGIFNNLFKDIIGVQPMQEPPINEYKMKIVYDDIEENEYRIIGKRNSLLLDELLSNVEPLA